MAFFCFFLSQLHVVCLYFFFFNDTATTEIYTLSLHDALPVGRKHVRLFHASHSRPHGGDFLLQRVIPWSETVSVVDSIRSEQRILRGDHLIDAGIAKILANPLVGIAGSASRAPAELRPLRS